MKLSFEQEYKLKKIIEHKLLEPLPEFIIGRGKDIKIHRPPIELRQDQAFEDWKKAHKDELPAWVNQVQRADVFYLKLWQLAELIGDLELCQQLPEFMRRYEDGVSGKSTAAPPPAMAAAGEPMGEPEPPSDGGETLTSDENVATSQEEQNEDMAAENDDDLSASLDDALG